VGQVEAFNLQGCRCWMYTGDHDAPHFHAGVPDEWEIRVYFLTDPVEYDVKFRIRRIPSRKLGQLLDLAKAHRPELLEQWSRSNPDD
jgi:Domain of unknown function (DUF4160)